MSEGFSLFFALLGLLLLSLPKYCIHLHIILCYSLYYIIYIYILQNPHIHICTCINNCKIICSLTSLT